MIRFKTTSNFMIVFSALLGLVFVIGCGGTAEKQAMSDLLKIYSDTVNEYAAADKSKKTEIEGKLDSLKSQWSEMKMEMGDEVTPQTLEKLEKEYEEITKKYASLNGSS